MKKKHRKQETDDSVLADADLDALLNAEQPLEPEPVPAPDESPTRAELLARIKTLEDALTKRDETINQLVARRQGRA